MATNDPLHASTDNTHAPTDDEDAQWMRAAIHEAQQAAARGEVPVGAIVVHEGRIIGHGSNEREATQDPTLHAEITAIRQAAQHLGSWRLIDCTIYVTLEPCPMCAGALVNSRISRVVWGCNDPKAGAVETLYNIGVDPRLNHRFATRSSVLRDECASLLSDFFRAARQRQST